MKKFKNGDIVVGTVALAGFLFLTSDKNILFNNSNNSVDNKENVGYIDIVNYKNNYISHISNEFYHEYKKEEEKNRLIALHNERMEQLEIERKKAEEERRRKLEEARKLREKEKQQVVISRGESEKVESDWMTFEASYYTSSCSGCSGFTKTEVDVRNTITHNGYRIIATDPKVIPMWSLVEVVTPHETFKALALDTGGVIKNHKIDVLVSTKKQAYKLGRHDVKLRVIKYGK